MTENLSQLKCIPCRGNTPPLQPEEINHLLKSIPDWKVVQKNRIKHLQRNFVFKDFEMALSFTNEVGEIAEREDHHPQFLQLGTTIRGIK